MKLYITSIVMVAIAFAGFCAGVDDEGNALTRETKFWRVDASNTSVGDIADFARIPNSVNRDENNAVTSAFGLSYSGVNLLFLDSTLNSFFFSGVANTAKAIESNDAAVFTTTKMNPAGIYQQVDEVANRVEEVSSDVEEVATEVAKKADGDMYDQELGIQWKLVMHNGNLYFVATTNTTTTAVQESE